MIDHINTEIISRYMEPNIVPLHDSAVSIGGWWVREKTNVAGCVYVGPWHSAIPAWNERTQLGAMREVEARLTEEQWFTYRDNLVGNGPPTTWHQTMFRLAVHAPAANKIKALAAVLKREAKP